METHRMPCKQAMAAACRSWGGNTGLLGECSGSEAWILERARKAADSNHELATEGPLWTHHLFNTLGYLHTPSPVNNSPVMNYMLWISEELDLKQLIFKYFYQKNFLIRSGFWSSQRRILPFFLLVMPLKRRIPNSHLRNLVLSDKPVGIPEQWLRFRSQTMLIRIIKQP